MLDASVANTMIRNVAKRMTPMAWPCRPSLSSPMTLKAVPVTIRELIVTNVDQYSCLGSRVTAESAGMSAGITRAAMTAPASCP